MREREKLPLKWPVENCHDLPVRRPPSKLRQMSGMKDQNWIWHEWFPSSRFFSLILNNRDFLVLQLFGCLVNALMFFKIFHITITNFCYKKMGKGEEAAHNQGIISWPSCFSSHKHLHLAQNVMLLHCHHKHNSSLNVANWWNVHFVLFSYRDVVKHLLLSTNRPVSYTWKNLQSPDVLHSSLWKTMHLISSKNGTVCGRYLKYSS